MFKNITEIQHSSLIISILVFFFYFPRESCAGDGVVAIQQSSGERQWSALHCDVPTTKSLLKPKKVAN
jgi:hypothetical protein